MGSFSHSWQLWPATGAGPMYSLSRNQGQSVGGRTISGGGGRRTVGGRTVRRGRAIQENRTLRGAAPSGGPQFLPGWQPVALDMCTRGNCPALVVDSEFIDFS